MSVWRRIREALGMSDQHKPMMPRVGPPPAQSLTAADIAAIRRYLASNAEADGDAAGDALEVVRARIDEIDFDPPWTLAARVGAILQFIDRVNGDGIEQFIWYDCERVPAALDTLRVHGPVRAAELLGRAVAMLPGGRPITDIATVEAWLFGPSQEQISVQCRAIDDEFFDMDPSRDVERTAMKLIAANPHEFVR